MKLPKLFGKKKEEDFDEDDFEVEELDDDLDDELEEALGSAESTPSPEVHEKAETAEHGEDEEMVGVGDSVKNPFEHDDDEYEDDDDDEYEDEYEDEASDKKKAIIFAAAGFGVLMLSILGGAGWWFFSDPGTDSATAPEKRPGSVELAMPAPPGSLNAQLGAPSLNAMSETSASGGVGEGSTAAQKNEAAPTQTAEAANGNTDVATTFAPSAADAAPATSLNSLNNLNSSGGTSSLGGGMVVPAVASSAMGRIADQPTAADQSQALTGAPVKGLIEEKNGIGKLPKISSKGAKPWQVYARPSDPGISEPKIALMIEGIGLSRQASLGAINKLPPAVSMILSPYANDLNDWVFRSRLAGHEVFVSLPMESEDFPLEDAGPLALDTRIQLAENQRRLDTVMASAGGYVGLVSFMGSRFMKAEVQMRKLFMTFGDRGVMFVVGGNRSRNDALTIAKELKLVHAESEMYIDEVPRTQQIRTSLDRLESIAKDRGSVLATARAYPVTIKDILDWVATIKEKGVVLVPASAIATVPEVPE